MALATTFFIPSAAQAQEVTISQQQLPAAVTKFVRTHFSGTTISNITREPKMRGVEYDLVLSDGTKMEFKNNRLQEIESPSRIPNSIIPASILNYVNRNYASSYIKEWNLDSRKQKVELNNGVELEFNRQGRFLRVDN